LNEELPLPEFIELTSELNPEFRITVPLDSIGIFSLEIPVGNYHVKSADSHTNVFNNSGNGNQLRIVNPKSNVLIVDKKHSGIRQEFQFTTLPTPDQLIGKNGLLNSFKSRDETVVDEFIKTYKDYFNISNVSLALIKENEIVYSNDYGYANAINETSLGEDHVWQVASITKSIFAYIVMRLADKEIIDLDKPLYEYLHFDQIKHNEGYELITARIVLSHQSGLPNWAWGGTGGWEYGSRGKHHKKDN